MVGRFVFLGSGGSMGIPVIGCQCPVCLSPSPFNKRLRPSGLVQIGPKKILIDAGPDFRQQALHYGINDLDGVIFTHAHHDHSAGIDELRVYYIKSRSNLPCLMSKETYADLKMRFGYILGDNIQQDPKIQLVSRLEVQLLPQERGEIVFVGQKIRYMSFTQAGMTVNGIRFGNMAYVSDIREYPESVFKDLEGVENLIVSALRFTPSAIHFNVDDAVDFSRKVGAKNTWLTHLSHELDHEKTKLYLPPNIQPAYDGLEFTFEEESS